MILRRFHRDNCTLRSITHGRTTSAMSVMMFKAAIAWKSALCDTQNQQFIFGNGNCARTALLTWLIHR